MRRHRRLDVSRIKCGASVSSPQVTVDKTRLNTSAITPESSQKPRNDVREDPGLQLIKRLPMPVCLDVLLGNMC